MRNRGLWAGVVSAAVWFGGAAYAGDWPRFRGPNGGGVAADANVPAKFTEKDFNWKIALPGVGHSSPVVVGKRVFVTCGEQATAKRFLICVDLDSGKTLWQREYAGKALKQHGDNSYASATPAADDKHVYFTFVGGDGYKVYALDHEGKDVWTYDVGPWVSQHGAGCSPIVEGDLVIVPNDQDGPTASVVALDKNTGSQKWSVNRKSGAAAASTPCVYRPKGGPAQLILTSSASGLSALDLASGKVLWAIADAMPFRSVGSPVATDAVVIGTSGQGADNRSCVVVQPQPDAGEPKLLHKLPGNKSYPYVPSPVVKGDLLFTWSDIGIVTCTKVATGEKVWQESVGQTYYSSPIVAGDKLINVTKKGEVIAVSATEKFELLGRSELGDKCHATPAVAGNRLIVRTASGMVSVGK